MCRLKTMRLRLWAFSSTASLSCNITVTISTQSSGGRTTLSLPALTRSSSDIRHFLFFLPKMYPSALMGCLILIWLHKKKIWAFIYLKRSTPVSQKLSEWPSKSREPSCLFFISLYKLANNQSKPPCNRVSRYMRSKQTIFYVYLYY